MKDKIEKVKDLLEREHNIYKRYLLSNMYMTFYEFLSEKEKHDEEKYLKKDYLSGSTSYFYDFLKNDSELFISFADKVEDRFERVSFRNYQLFSINKVNFKEVREIVSLILDDMNIFNKDKLYNFDKINFKDLSDYNGMCLNTFGIFDDNIFLNNNIDKFVTFVRTLVHEIGHSYENIFMQPMSIVQQLDRYDHCFIEVMSTFFERVALDYLIRNHIYLDDANRELNNYYYLLDDRLLFLKEISSSPFLDDFIYDEFDIICERESFCDDVFDKNDVVLYSVNYNEYINYGYGTLLGEYFFDIYCKDKKEALKKLRNFVAKQGIFDEREMFNSINFRDNDFSFLDKGLKENITYMRKRYKW